MKNDNLLNEKCDNYFEIDDNIYTDDPNEQYKDQEIIMMQYAGLKQFIIFKWKGWSNQKLSNRTFNFHWSWFFWFTYNF